MPADEEELNLSKLDRLIQIDAQPVEDFEMKLGRLISEHAAEGDEEILRALDLYVGFVSERQD